MWQHFSAPEVKVTAGLIASNTEDPTEYTAVLGSIGTPRHACND